MGETYIGLSQEKERRVDGQLLKDTAFDLASQVKLAVMMGRLGRNALGGSGALQEASKHLRQRLPQLQRELVDAIHRRDILVGTPSLI
tara:strand:- start:122 stop:385 length:264 start_codon:yes stop_codon:yes gene_type:complete